MSIPEASRQQGQFRQPGAGLRSKDELTVQAQHLFSYQRDLLNWLPVLIETEDGQWCRVVQIGTQNKWLVVQRVEEDPNSESFWRLARFVRRWNQINPTLHEDIASLKMDGCI